MCIFPHDSAQFRLARAHFKFRDRAWEIEVDIAFGSHGPAPSGGHAAQPPAYELTASVPSPSTVIMTPLPEDAQAKVFVGSTRARGFS